MNRDMKEYNCRDLKASNDLIAFLEWMPYCFIDLTCKSVFDIP
jgi:hypothetical protein